MVGEQESELPRSRLYVCVKRIASWRTLAIGFIAALVITQLFAWRSEKLGNENKVLDARASYTAEDAVDFALNIKPNGCHFYGLTELTIDVAFPLVYATLFAIILVQLFSEKLARWLVAIPIAAATLDVLENVFIAIFCFTLDHNQAFDELVQEFSTHISVSELLTRSKFVLVACALIAIFIGGIFDWRKNEREQSI